MTRSSDDAPVREATREDLPALVVLEEAAFPDTPWSAESLERQLERHDHLTLVIGGVAGSAPVPILRSYAGFQILADDEAELLRLATDPAHRGRGLGRRLLAAGLEALATRGLERCHLEVSAANAPALAVYRKAGFAQVGRRPRYYRDGSDALLLTWTTFGSRS